MKTGKARLKLIGLAEEINLEPIPPLNIKVDGVIVAPGVEFYLEITFNDGGLITPSLMIYHGETRADLQFLLGSHCEGAVVSKIFSTLANFIDEPHIFKVLGASIAGELSEEVILEINHEEHLPEDVHFCLYGDGFFAETVVRISRLIEIFSL